MPSCDAIIIGGGTNGLAAAGRLAKAGRKVLVLESAAAAGGGATTMEFAKGYKVSPVAHLLNLLDPRVEQGLGLSLSFAATNISTTALSPTGDHLVLQGNYGETISGNLPEADRVSWLELRQKLMRFANVLKPFKAMTPPRLGKGVGNEMLKLAGLGLKIRGLGRDDLREFMRLMLINVADVLDDELKDERLKGVAAFDTVLGAHLGPRSPNSLLLLLNRLAGETLSLPAGGMGSVAVAMAKAVQALGVDIRVNAKVKSVNIVDDKATGVTLQNGEVIEAKMVISAINPKTTFLDLVGPRHLDTGMVRRAGNILMRGNAVKLHLALKGAPNFKGADLKTRLVIAPSVRVVEDAFNPVKYGEFSHDPVMEIVIPSAFEEGLAPKGHHVLSAIVQYAPVVMDAKARAAFLKRIMATLESYAPGIGKLVVKSELLTPEDLENQYGFVGGNWHHGELAAEQMLFLRPFIGAAQYETAIPGLWLAGAGSHPGGGISGAAGWNAAERILKMEGRR
ncbi:MAG: NAD(P)/FAD-dependent oxidoreductase [Hyphomicrobiales bacterium]|nr:NAD(P)/FAD-dependent oxidoreductase [Hyphomicrobiales bacterium]